MMDILIINLERSVDRRIFQQEQFKKIGLPVQFLAAVTTDDISDTQFEAEAFGWERPLKRVELACFLSHKKAWRYVQESNKPALIIEDDAVVVKDLALILSELENSTVNFSPDLVNLEVRSRKKIVGQQPIYQITSTNYDVLELFQERTGTGGYVLYPSGARKLLEKAKKNAAATADAFIFSTYELNAFQVEPAALIQEDQMVAYGLADKEKFESTIGRSEHFKPVYKSLAEKRKFRQRRWLGQWNMACRYLQVMFKSEKRFIRLDQSKFQQD